MKGFLTLFRSSVRHPTSWLDCQHGLSLTEVLVALGMSALILTGAVGMITSWSTAARTLPVAGSRGASDAQVQQMVAELRNMVAVSYISAGELVARINTAANYPNPLVVNGTPTGTYSVAYYYLANAHTLYRNGSGTVKFSGAGGGWQAIADNLASLSFAGYDVNMNPTPIAAQVSTIGITVQYPGLQQEQEMLTLRGTSAYTTSYSRPLAIPPPSGPAAVLVGGGGGDHSGPSATVSSSQTAGFANITGPDGFNVSVSFGTPTSDMAQIGNPAFASGISGQYSGTSVGYGMSILDAAAASVHAAIDLEKLISVDLDRVLAAVNTGLQADEAQSQVATSEGTSPPGTSGGDPSSTGGDSSGGGDSGGGGGDGPSGGN